jgi:hypothetical protein
VGRRQEPCSCPWSSPGGSQLPDASGGAQQSPRGLPGSSHEVAGSAAPMVIPQPTGDARHRHIHPHDPLTYPREKTHAAVRANNLLKKTR